MHIDMGNNDIYILSRGGDLNRFQDIMINYKIQKFPFQIFKQNLCKILKFQTGNEFIIYEILT